MKITRLAGNLGWPEGPSVLPDGRVIFGLRHLEV
jgi:hypothetical protein